MTLLGVVLLAAFQVAPLPPPSDAVKKQVGDLARELATEDAHIRAKVEERLLALSPEAPEALLEAAKTAGGAQLEAIREILPKFGPSAIEQLFRGSHRSQFKQQMAEDEAIKAVARMGATAIPELRRLSTTPYKHFVIGVLMRMGSVGVDELVRLLKHPDREVRSSAATALANKADARSADALLGALEGDDPVVWMYAAIGLGHLRDRRALAPLLRLLSDANPSHREAAAGALGKMYEPQLFKPLARAARNDPEPGVRRIAANALMRSADPVAARLGRRYRPIRISPATEQILQLAVIVRLAVTGLAIYALLWAGMRFSKQSGPLTMRRGVWWALLGIAGVGFVWGRLLTGLSGTVELFLLLACVPAAAWFVWTAGPRPKVLLWPASGLGVGCLLVTLAPLGGMLGFVVLTGVAPWVVVGVLAVSPVIAWWMGRNADPVERRTFGRAAVVGMVAFYVGYGIGWAALWGYLSA